jgi:RND family efflux transporter MFP subunit
MPVQRSIPSFPIPAFLLIALGGVLAGCGDREAPAAAAMAPPKVTVALPLRRATVTWDRYVGRLEAVREVEIRARVSGYLDAIHFDEGQIVTAGDLLYEIDARPFEAELARARALGSEAKARVAEAAAALARAEAERKASDAVLALARNRLERARLAAESNAVARETVDIRESELLQADAANLAAAARIEAARAAIESATAAVATAAAAIESAQIDLDYTRIEAPITGRIGQRLVHEGNLVIGGAISTTLLTTIVSIDPIHCYFEADEQEYLKYTRLAMTGARESSRLAKNPVYVALQDEVGYPHVGHMDFVDNRLDAATGTMRARAILGNADGSLVPGLFVTLRLPGSARREVVLVPDAAIATDQSERLVFVVGDGDVVARRVVTLGPMIDGLRAIESGLEGDERVVIRGLQRIQDGVVVAPSLESIAAEPVEDGLPDDYAPLPKERWLSIDDPAKRPAGAAPAAGREGEK